MIYLKCLSLLKSTTDVLRTFVQKEPMRITVDRWLEHKNKQLNDKWLDAWLTNRGKYNAEITEREAIKLGVTNWEDDNLLPYRYTASAKINKRFTEVINEDNGSNTTYEKIRDKGK